jgi:hypothetical protein
MLVIESYLMFGERLRLDMADTSVALLVAPLKTCRGGPSGKAKRSTTGQTDDRGEGRCEDGLLQDQLDELDESLALAEMEQHGQGSEELVENGEVRTPVGPSFFEELERLLPSEERLVSPPGMSSNRKDPVFTELDKFLRRVDTFRRAQVAA